MNEFPELIKDEKELDEVMTKPTPQLVDFMKKLKGDIIVLGIGGKMGITLGGLAVNAIKEAKISKTVYGVSRFSNPEGRKVLEDFGVKTIACDLLDPDSVNKLPKVENVIFMAGKKFGTQGEEAMTWAMNTVVPTNVARHFKGSNILAFSTGCVYPLEEITSGGSTEERVPAPIGDYAQSTLGRERVFEYYSITDKTPLCLYRLNYAIDLRYGVMRDIGENILNDEPVDITSSHVNVIWQGDANSQALLCLGQCKVNGNVMNITGPETLSVKWIANEFAKYFDKTPTFSGEPSERMYLNNSSYATELFGYPSVGPKLMIKWIAAWLKSGGKSLNKRTHFEVTSGKY
ncbi:MAG: epimerase [Planctomycetota bacterium]|nr:MAG: epimerase [Planctomycetota bacterium]